MKHGAAVKASNKSMLVEPNDSGLLIVFEGLDGSGKTTQRKLLKSWLNTIQQEVVVTKWSSSQIFKPVIKARKTARLLDPASYSILHAGDFWHRVETVISPNLCAGKTVLADRYVFTGIARDVARGLTREWCTHLYTGARKPDLVFYFAAAPETCAQRIRAGRQIKFYEAGQDVTGIKDPLESYLQFAARVEAEYRKLSYQFRFVVVDAEEPIYEQHRFIRETCLRYSPTPTTVRSLTTDVNALLTEVDV